MCDHGRHRWVEDGVRGAEVVRGDRRMARTAAGIIDASRGPCEVSNGVSSRSVSSRSPAAAAARASIDRPARRGIGNSSTVPRSSRSCARGTAAAGPSCTSTESAQSRSMEMTWPTSPACWASRLRRRGRMRPRYPASPGSSFRAAPRPGRRRARAPRPPGRPGRTGRGPFAGRQGVAPWRGPPGRRTAVRGHRRVPRMPRPRARVPTPRRAGRRRVPRRRGGSRSAGLRGVPRARRGHAPCPTGLPGRRLGRE